MKRIVLVFLAICTTVLFTSCSDFWDNMFGKITGKATTSINGAAEDEYSSSIVMRDKKAPVPFYVGIAMNMDIDDLMDIDNEEQIEYPIFCYRFTGNNIKSGATLTANNTLTEEELVDMKYTDIISGKFSDNQIVGIAESDTKFYVMSSGTIKLDKVNGVKVTGHFSGRAYVIDRNAEPMLAEEQIAISGTFISRLVPMMAWVKKLQKK